MYERGGGYFLEEYIDLSGVMIRLGNVESNLAATPFLTLAPTTLDALDAEGEITYFAKIDEGHPRNSRAASSAADLTATGRIWIP